MIIVKERQYIFILETIFVYQEQPGRAYVYRCMDYIKIYLFLLGAVVFCVLGSQLPVSSRILPAQVQQWMVHRESIVAMADGKSLYMYESVHLEGWLRTVLFETDFFFAAYQTMLS